MPNNVTNNLEFYGEQKNINHVFALIAGTEERQYIDFNKIIYMPESLNIESGSKTDRAILAYSINNADKLGLVKDMRSEYGKEWVKDILEDITQMSVSDFSDLYNKGKIYYENYEKYGATTWYDWRRYNWGTKWNAYDQDRNGNLITFLTAWSTPEKIYTELAKICQRFNVTFSVKFGDEDYGGGNCGYIEATDGQINIHYCETDTEAIEIYKEIWGFNPFANEDEE